MQSIFVIASDLSAEEHMLVLTEIQKHVDLSCSKIINLPNNATINDIEDIYLKSWERGAKGVTVYRDGSRENQTLSVKRESEILTNKFDYIDPVSKDVLGETYGTNVKKKVACGNLYINICRDNEGNLVEVFVNTGKGGICQSNINSVSRLVSTSLRSGVKVEEIIDQLKGIVCHACSKAISKGERLSGVSCADIIAKTLYDEYNKDEIIIKSTNRKTVEKIANENNVCPECHKNFLRLEGGCVVCSECGWSKCY